MSDLFDVKAMYDLSGQLAIVTGAAQGMGREIAHYITAAGATVAAVDRNEAGVRKAAEALNAAGGRVFPYCADVSDEQAVRELVRSIRREHGRIDMLVNNAAIMDREYLLETSAELWMKVHRVNLLGPFLCLRETAMVMKEDGTAGRIVSISSIGSIHPFSEALTAYGASKSGLNGLIRNAALELAPHRIRVNAVLPSFIETEGALTSPGPEVKEDQMPHIPPLGRFGKPSDVAGVVLFLLSDASRYMTAQLVQVDGGFMIS